MFNQERPNAIDCEQIEREKDNGHQRDERRVFDQVRARPGNTSHFRARVVQELPDSREEARCGHSLLRTTVAIASRRAGFRFHRRRGRWRVGRFLDRLRFNDVVVAHGNFSKPLRHFVFAIQLAGVPGFEPGLSVLETDVLAVDTIPLKNIFDCRSPIAD